MKGRSILIVEDEPLIALDIAEAFAPTGAVLTTTTTLQHALILVRHDGLSAAILDHALSDGDSSELCEILTQRGIPFIIYSGFVTVDGACRDAPHLAKPAPAETIVAMLENLILRPVLSN